jgi:hypothetical protein
MLVASGMVACAQPAASGGVPARWIAPVDAACIAQAEAFASHATGRQVTLGAAAFAQSSRLVLERNVARDAQGRPLDGRQRPEAPEVFDLLLRDGACVMRHEASGREAVLTACRGEPQPVMK